MPPFAVCSRKRCPPCVDFREEIPPETFPRRRSSSKARSPLFLLQHKPPIRFEPEVPLAKRR